MKLSVREMAVFSMLGAVMYLSKLLMDWAPNIHLLGMFVVAFTVVYRKKALYPIYLFVFLTGALNGFGTWWVPYLYIWTVLWGLVKKLPSMVKNVLYILVCSAHGFLFGVLYAPAQALLFGLSFNGMIAWIIAGLPFDMIHGVSNLICGFLIMPIVYILQYMERRVS